MVRQQFAKLRPRKGSCGFDPHTLRQKIAVTLTGVAAIFMQRRVWGSNGQQSTPRAPSSARERSAGGLTGVSPPLAWTRKARIRRADAESP